MSLRKRSDEEQPVMEMDVSESDFSHVKLNDLKSKYPTVFDTSKLGCCTKMKAELQLKEGAKPVFKKARPLPFTQRNSCKEELDRLVKANVLQKIDYSDWAVPIVVVSKPHGNKVRICGDFVEINKRCDTQQHPCRISMICSVKCKAEKCSLLWICLTHISKSS